MLRIFEKNKKYNKYLVLIANTIFTMSLLGIFIVLLSWNSKLLVIFAIFPILLMSTITIITVIEGQNNK